MRPTLRPGVHVLRRGDRELQVGLDPRTAVVLPDEPRVRTALALIERAAPESEHTDRSTLDILRAADLVLDGNRLLSLLPSCAGEASGSGARAATFPGRHDVAALARAAGDAAAERLAARRHARVLLRGFGGDVAATMASAAESLLRGAGVGLAETPGRRARTSAPTLGVLAGLGEPARELLDDWVRDDLPHLLVRIREDAAVVGPFVVPGRAACLRCLDAHHADVDPSWPLLVAQDAARCDTDGRDGVPAPADNLLTAVAVAWAARDVTTYVEGGRPSTWSATVRFAPHLAAVETESWLRHPECGCAWS